MDQEIGPGPFQKTAGRTAGQKTVSYKTMWRLGTLFQSWPGMFQFEGRRKSSAKGFIIKFGIVEEERDGNYHVARETTTIPLLLRQTGFTWGYSVTAPDEEPFAVHEILYMPAPPKNIEFSVPIDQRDGGRTIITSALMHQGYSVNFFRFDQGDPLGIWKLGVYVNELPVRTIRFSVVPVRQF